MKAELKPCPFCGEKEEIDYGYCTGTLKGFDYVRCDNCGATIEAVHTKAFENAAFQLWNKRAPEGNGKETAEVGKPATAAETYAYQETPIHCPFCVGNNKNAVLCGDERNREYFVFCEICGIETKESYRRKESAIAAFAAKKTRKIEGDKGNA